MLSVSASASGMCSARQTYKEMGDKKSLFGQINLSVVNMSQIIYNIKVYLCLYNILTGKEKALDIICSFKDKVLDKHLFENVMPLLPNFCLPSSQSFKVPFTSSRQADTTPAFALRDGNLGSPWH